VGYLTTLSFPISLVDRFFMPYQQLDELSLNQYTPERRYGKNLSQLQVSGS
jgi:hypothetical protein